jgi:hypothetical protein
MSIVFREDYVLSNWLFDLADIMSRMDFIEHKQALRLIVEDIEEVLEMYMEGMSPQQAYRETVE